MDCDHFRPNMPLSDQLRVGLALNRADACALLLPSDPRHEEYRAALQAEGFKLVPAFTCPFGSGARWKFCPYYAKPAKRGNRRR
jgi:hypothetical protein